MNEAVTIDLAGQSMVLHPDRALLWPAQRTAFIADLHLGKAEVFRRTGIPIPEGDARADLARLAALVDAFSLQRIVALGDFVHAASTHAAADALLAWRATHPSVELIVIAGNHDRRAAGAELTRYVTWQAPGYALAPFVCMHESAHSAMGYVLAGHLHPVITLRGSHRQRMRAPVCWVRSDYTVLPAFGAFTGGAEIDAVLGDQVFAFAAGRVWRVPV